jgi:hypothetical protein
MDNEISEHTEIKLNKSKNNSKKLIIRLLPKPKIVSATLSVIRFNIAKKVTKIPIANGKDNAEKSTNKNNIRDGVK